MQQKHKKNTSGEKIEKKGNKLKKKLEIINKYNFLKMAETRQPKSKILKVITGFYLTYLCSDTNVPMTKIMKKFNLAACQQSYLTLVMLVST